MNKRRAARELTLLTLSQLSKNQNRITKLEVTDIIQLSVETLKTEAENDLNSAVRALAEIREFIQNYEIEHPKNLESPVDKRIVPVKLPMTSDMLGRIEEILKAADKTYSAIEMVEIASLEDKEEVKDYVTRLSKAVLENKQMIDNEIKEHSKGWNVNRLIRVDRDILRIALAEILLFDDIPASVAIDEAVEIAKKYSTEESSRFINGILGSIRPKEKNTAE